jgi:hypothetical protein
MEGESVCVYVCVKVVAGTRLEKAGAADVVGATVSGVRADDERTSGSAAGSRVIGRSVKGHAKIGRGEWGLHCLIP